MKTNFLYAVLASIILLTSCAKEELENPDVTQMDFENLEVGDIFKYQLLTGSLYGGVDEFQYSNDTLILEVTGELEEGYIIKEYIDIDSEIFSSDSLPYLNNVGDIYFNKWVISKDTLNVNALDNSIPQSHLFGGLSYIVLPLKKNDATKLNITGWRTDFKYDDINQGLYAADYELKGIEYDHLNILIDNSLSFAHGDGYTIIYNKDKGIVKTAVKDYPYIYGYGWDRI